MYLLFPSLLLLFLNIFSFSLFSFNTTYIYYFPSFFQYYILFFFVFSLLLLVFFSFFLFLYCVFNISILFCFLVPFFSFLIIFFLALICTCPSVFLMRWLFISLFKGTVSWDRFQKCWWKWTDLGLFKGRGWFFNFSEAPLIFCWKKTSVSR